LNAHILRFVNLCPCSIWLSWLFEFHFEYSREQDVKNPSWANIQLFNPGTNLSPGQLDVRFSSVWCQYSDEMMSRSWAGVVLHRLLKNFALCFPSIVWIFF
jgi:hypothetical protein